MKFACFEGISVIEGTKVTEGEKYAKFDFKIYLLPVLRDDYLLRCQHHCAVTPLSRIES
jgi:hypothetical protein